MDDKSEFLVNILADAFNQYCGHDAWLFCGIASTEVYRGYRFRFEDYHFGNPVHQVLVSLVTERLNDCFTEGTWCLQLDQDYIGQFHEGPFNQSSYLDIIFQEDHDTTQIYPRDIDNDIIEEMPSCPVIDPRNSRIDFSSYSANSADMEVDSICQGINQINLNHSNEDNLQYYTSSKMYLGC